jgi:hypothetical protein
MAFSYLLSDYVKQDNQQKRLGNEISQSRQTLLVLASPDPELTALFEESDKANQAVKKSLAGSNESATDVIDKILSNAEQSQVQVIPITSGDNEEKTIGTTTYRFQPLELTITGRLPDVLIFLEKLENPVLYRSVIVTNLSINRNRLADTTDAELVTGSLSLAIVSEKQGIN